MSGKQVLTEKELLDRKEIGDIKVVAAIIDVDYFNAAKILKRTNSKLHSQAIEALRLVVESRENLIKKAKEVNLIMNGKKPEYLHV